MFTCVTSSCGQTLHFGVLEDEPQEPTSCVKKFTIQLILLQLNQDVPLID